MKALLMHRDRDFDPQQELPWQAEALTQDLALEPLLGAMAGGDRFVLGVARTALLSDAGSDVPTILYRQAILRDCLAHTPVVRKLYAVAVEALERKSDWRRLGIFTRYPAGILTEALELMQFFVGMLKQLRAIADEHGDAFVSEGFRGLFALIRDELSDDYLHEVQEHLRTLAFRRGVLISARLGEGNAGTDYVLRRPKGPEPTWLDRLLGKAPPAHTFTVDPRDEAGARMLGELRDRGINLVANALAQSADHVESFFQMLRVELAFYMGCMNLREQLAALGEPTCFPEPASVGEGTGRCTGLYDVSLALTMGRPVVGNTMDADGKGLVLITGANQGGKSTFLRSVGQAQLMMQCGMFVPAESYASDTAPALFTHYKREEDATMARGKLDEELARMSAIADRLRPHAMVLFNESFASTNEREGSEIAGQVVRALRDRDIRVLFVTHLHEFARGFYESRREDALFLRAERQADGTRTFRVEEGEPLATSYGADLYRQRSRANPLSAWDHDDRGVRRHAANAEGRHREDSQAEGRGRDLRRMGVHGRQPGPERTERQAGVHRRRRRNGEADRGGERMR